MENHEIKNAQFVIDNAHEGVLFLKRNKDFPLQKPCKIGLFGLGVRYLQKGGTGSGEVNSRCITSIEEAFNDNKFIITSNDWLDKYDELFISSKKKFYKRLKKEAKENHLSFMYYAMGRSMPSFEYDLPINIDGDVAIYILSRLCGEGSDRLLEKGDIYLNDSEIRDILYLNKHYKKFMLVLNVGGPVDLSPIVHEVNNILLLSQLGPSTSSILVDILLGKNNPSGKLSTSWAKYVDYQTIGTFGDNDESYYKEGIYVGYRYFSSINKEILFPFGYGLSYTDFKIDNPKIEINKDKINIKCDVTNTGNYIGKEVVQVYVNQPNKKLDKPKIVLLGFNKTDYLSPNQNQQINITCDLKDISSYDVNRECYFLEEGSYIIRLGNSSINNSPIGVINIKEDIIIKKVKNLFNKVDFNDYQSEYEIEVDKNLPSFEFDINSIKEEIINYDKEDEIIDIAKGMEDEELAYLLVGAFSEKGGLSSVVGNAGKSVPGAAGETTSKLIDKYHIRPLVLADGPQGVRLTKEYYLNSKGEVISDIRTLIPESFKELASGILKIMLKIIEKRKPPKGAIKKEQYCTNIPIATSIAQSFNLDYAYQCGQIVKNEMEIYHVDYWLAPALNIHRSILNGRNFEYYSEDPLLSGYIAGYITKGVQDNSNKAVTLKHYFANNQENNRYGHNANISERAIREIYLRGFEIANRIGKPLGFMSSYNLVNGVHTAENKAVSYDILRQEWNFKGIIMTDWIVNMSFNKRSKHKNTSADKAFIAGTDLFMPGHKKDYDKILKVIKSDNKYRILAEESASRIIRIINKMK